MFLVLSVVLVSLGWWLQTTCPKRSPDRNQVAFIDGTAAANKMFILRLTKLIKCLGMLWKLTFKVILLLKESLCVHQITAFLSNCALKSLDVWIFVRIKYSHLFTTFQLMMLVCYTCIFCTQGTQLQLHHIFCGMKPLTSHTAPTPPPPSPTRDDYNYIHPKVSITYLSGCPHRLLALIYIHVLWQWRACTQQFW